MKPKLKLKTNQQLADYLAFISPKYAHIYQAIAIFFGPDELIPKPRNKTK